SASALGASWSAPAASDAKTSLVPGAAAWSHSRCCAFPGSSTTMSAGLCHSLLSRTGCSASCKPSFATSAVVSADADGGDSASDAALTSSDNASSSCATGNLSVSFGMHSAPRFTGDLTLSVSVNVQRDELQTPQDIP